MDFTLLVFLAFAVVTVVAAGAVISVRSPVYAALCLVLTFFTVACTWILADAEFLGIALVVRSEEHTSELQSLMRISYAVFCLKKKKKTNNYTCNSIYTSTLHIRT